MSDFLRSYLSRILDINGTTVKVLAVPRDGDCLFFPHSLSLALY